MREKILKALIYSVVIITPLIVVPGIIHPFTLPKVVYFFMAMDVGMIFLLISKIESAKFFLNLRSPLNILLGSFFIVQIISALWGAWPLQSFLGSLGRMTGIVTFFHLCCFFLLLKGAFKNHDDWRSFFKVYIAVGIPVALIAIVQRFISITFLNFSSALQVVSTIGNASYLGYYTISQFFISWWLFKSAETSRARMYFAGVMGLSALATIATEVRGIFIAFLAGLMAVGMQYLWHALPRGGQKNFSKQYTRILLIAAVISTIVVAGSFAVVKFFPETKLAHTVSRLSDISLTSTTVQTRLLTWQIGFQAFLDKPLLGWGPENFENAFNIHYDPRLFRFGEKATWFDKAHNLYINTFVETGIIGGLLLMSILGIVLYYARKNRLFLGLIVAYLVTSLAEVENTISLIVFFMLMAYLETAWMHETKKTGTVDTSTEEPTWRLSILRVCLSMLFLASLMYNTVFAVNVWRTEHAIIALFRGGPAVAAQFIDSFENAYHSARFTPHLQINTLDQAVMATINRKTLKPDEEIPIQILEYLDQKIQNVLPELPASDVRMRYVYGRLVKEWALLEPEKFDTAIAIFEDGLAVNERRQPFLIQLAELYLHADVYLKSTTGETTQKALDLMRQAIIADEDAGPTHEILGRMYAVYGMQEESQQELTRARELMKIYVPLR